MIKISIDEAFAFDMLSIAAVKAIRLNKNNQFNTVADDLADSLGIDKVEQIVDSIDYQRLFKTNLYIFDCLENVEAYKASYIDRLNLLRYKLKTRIQNKFFNSTCLEVKSK